MISPTPKFICRFWLVRISCSGTWLLTPELLAGSSTGSFVKAANISRLMQSIAEWAFDLNMDPASTQNVTIDNEKTSTRATMTAPAILSRRVMTSFFDSTAAWVVVAFVVVGVATFSSTIWLRTISGLRTRTKANMVLMTRSRRTIIGQTMPKADFLLVGLFCCLFLLDCKVSPVMLCCSNFFRKPLLMLTLENLPYCKSYIKVTFLFAIEVGLSRANFTIL